MKTVTRVSMALASFLAITSVSLSSEEFPNPSVTIAPLVYQLEHDLQSVLFPEIQPYHEAFLEVSKVHRLWFAEYGNPAGVPIVVVHGGPGFGCSPRDMRFFDPNFYRIVLVDQRGAGKSTPHASMEDNTTQDLIADFERLREHLGIERWALFGGSWGSALAMAYGEKHPARCLGFILRGVFLGTKREYDQLWYGMKDHYPEAWDELNSFIPAAERGDLLEAYHRRLNDPDRTVHMAAAQAFAKYDLTAAFALQTPAIDAMLKDEKMVLGVSRGFAHYCKNNFFLEENQLLGGLDAIKHLPVFIVHGRLDAICLPSQAYDLAKYWPGSQLTFVQDAGHSAAEPGIAKALVEATKQMQALLK